MGKITFIIGGARSGKSAFALKLAGKTRNAAFIATCEPKDCEMQKRVLLHKQARPAHWKTFESPYEATVMLKKINPRFDCILIDCLTLMVSNLMLKGFKQSRIENKIKELVNALKKIKAQSIIVSNEVGMGIVPENKLAREFRDVAGRMNQLVTQEADTVFFMVSGLGLRMK